MHTRCCVNFRALAASDSLYATQGTANKTVQMKATFRKCVRFVLRVVFCKPTFFVLALLSSDWLNLAACYKLGHDIQKPRFLIYRFL